MSPTPTSPTAAPPPPSVTVALVPDARYDRLRALAARWVDAWLIDPLLLVRTGALAMSVAPGGGVPVVAGELLGRGLVRPVHDVVAHLAALEPSPELVRVVDLVLGAAEGELADETWTALREEADAVAEVIRTAAGTRAVRRVALLALGTGRTAVPGRLRDAPQPGWDVNVMATAENRANPGGFDVFVRPDEQEYDGFVLTHLATVAGLWAGVRSGSYDRDVADVEGHLELQRVTVRAVQHGDRRVHAAWTAAAVLLDDPGPTARGMGPVLAADGAELGVLDGPRQDRVLDEYARRIMDEPPDRPLRVRVDDTVRVPAPERGGPGAVLRALVRDSVGLVRRVATRVRRLGRGGPPPEVAPGGVHADTAADGGATRWLAELDAALARSFVLDPPGVRIFVPGVALWGAGSRRHAAGVWRRVHGPAVALLDGGDPPGAWAPLAWMREQRFEGVLPGPGAIVPDHLETWTLPAVVGRLLGLPEDAAAVRVRATDRIAIRYRWATLQPLVVRAQEVLAEAEADGGDGAGDGGGGGDPWPDPVPDPDVAAGDPASPGMTPAQARAVLAADAALAGMLARLDATGLGRVQRAREEEFDRLARALETVRDRLAEALDGRSRRSWRDALLRGAVVPLLALLVAPLLPVAAGAGLVLAAAAAGGAYALGAVRGGRRLDAAVRARLLVDLSDVADRLLDEWRRDEHMRSDLDDMVVLMSHLLHHGAAPTGADRPEVEPLSHDDVPWLVRLAVPVVRDDADVSSGLDPRQVGRCLERQLVAGWRAEVHGWLAEEVTAAAPGLFGGRSVHEAVDSEPRRAADLLERLGDADGAHEHEVFRRLVRRGVGVLEGLDLARGRAEEPERSAPGTTGSPAARVRVLEAAVPSLDLRTDGLAPSLPDHPVWDAFLLDGALPAGVDVRDPWGSHTFRLTPEAARVHGRQRTEVHLPARLVAAAERRRAAMGAHVDPDVAVGDGAADPLTWVPLVGEEVRFVEVVVRVDTQPQPVSMSVLRALGATEATG